MPEPVKVTKAQILQGKQRTQEFEFEIEIDGELQMAALDLRPLSDGEWAEVEAVRFSGQAVSAGMDDMEDKSKAVGMRARLDVGMFMNADYDADCRAAAYGLTCNKERWSISEVQRLRPPGVVEQIAGKVYDLSGVTPEAKAEVASFRDDDPGTADSAAPSGGDPAGPDPG